MVDRDLVTIAREWWAGDGTQDAFAEVDQIVAKVDRLPELLRAMVDTVL